MNRSPGPDAGASQSALSAGAPATTGTDVLARNVSSVSAPTSCSPAAQYTGPSARSPSIVPDAVNHVRSATRRTTGVVTDTVVFSVNRGGNGSVRPVLAEPRTPASPMNTT